MNERFTNQTPVRSGSTEEFATIARTLKHASFDEETICRTFKLKDMSDLGSITTNDISQADISAELGLLIRLFLSLDVVERSEAEKQLGGNVLKSFLSLGLLGVNELSENEIYARALLYPVGGFLIASDRHSSPDDNVFEPPPDVVFPAIFAGTLDFLRLLPKNWKGAALDLCSGTGIGAFVLSRSGNAIVSADITQRAADFARFNCALNNIHNVEVVRGDLFEAVPGRTFACIVAHPPYVPSLEARAIWRDGGKLGEALVKRVINELPQHLDPGGVFLCVSLGVDTDKASFEHRVRGWLGSSADQFDLLFACKEQRQPRQVLDNLAKKYPEWGPDVLDKFESEFQREGVVNMPLGALYLKRQEKIDTHPAITVRTRLSSETDGADFETAFTTYNRRCHPEFLASLERATPRLAPRLEVKVTHVVNEGNLVPADFLFEIDKPFEARLRFEGWMVPLLARLDGQTTLSQIYEEARVNGAIPNEFKLENLAVLVARTLELGYTLLD